MEKHQRWKTVKELKNILNEYDDDCLVFIQPHKEAINYPFQIFQIGDNVCFRLYEDMLLPLTLEQVVDGLKWKVIIKLSNWWKRNGIK